LHTAVVTSRFNTLVTAEEIKPIDLEVEIVGLSKQNSRAYLDDTGFISTKDALEVMKFIEESALSEELLRVSILLDFMCGSLDEV
jgi:hypothetical protein